MYRKHLKEMELSSSSKNSSQNKTGMKTIDAISEIPVVNSALNNVTEYYGKMKKDSNLLFRTSLNLAELSVSVMSIAATPITTLCKRPSTNLEHLSCFRCSISHVFVCLLYKVYLVLRNIKYYTVLLSVVNN